MWVELFYGAVMLTGVGGIAWVTFEVTRDRWRR